MSDSAMSVPSLEDELDAQARQYTEAGYAPGLVYGITDAAGLRHGSGFGTAGSSGRPSLDTVFPIASLSKSFFACAAVIARDEGLLSLSDPVTDHVPEFRIAQRSGSDVPTLEMLLGMHGGLTEDNAWIDPQIDVPMAALLEQLSRGVRLSHPPGTAYEYSNLGYAVSALAVSRAVGRPIAAYLRDRVLDPLGLHATFLDSEVPDGVDRAVGFRRSSDGGWSPFEWRAADSMLGACGLTSSVRDLATWMTWLGAGFRSGPLDDSDGVLSRQSRRDLQRIRALVPPTLAVTETGMLESVHNGYALGLKVGMDVSGGTVISHTGGLPGFALAMAWRPESGYGSVVLTNSGRGEAVRLCSDVLARVVAREDAPSTVITLWPETVALLDRADQLIRGWDDTVADEVFAANIDFDRPLAERRAEIESFLADVGPAERRPTIVAAESPADVTWLMQGERGSLLCRIHVTPTEPAQIQEFTVKPIRANQTWTSALIQLSSRRPRGMVFSPALNARVQSHS
jgi:CubicO group peptidase (beta-lactamase class C family)